jgi:REP element-mobilizing transposase RayT
MARPVRIEYPGAVYHVTSRGNERRTIFQGDSDREAFLAFLCKAVKRFGWSLSAWVLMPNHFHLVVQTPEPNLSRGMHWLNGCYAGWFNREHERWGHLFGGRFKAFIIEKETYLTEVLRYVVLNPVRAKDMVDRPEDYRWSSYRATAGLEEAPEWLDLSSALSSFGAVSETTQASYRAFVAEKIASTENLWDRLINGIYLGTETWAKSMRRVLQSKPRSREHPRKQRAVGRPKADQIIRVVSALAGTRARMVRATRGGPVRRLIAWIGWNEGLLPLRVIARSLGLRSLGHVSNEIRRCERELTREPQMVALAERALIRFQR